MRIKMDLDWCLSSIVFACLLKLSVQQSCPQSCVCANNGYTTITCTSLDTIPPILSEYKGLFLDFANNSDIPSGSFKDLTDIRTIQLTGTIGKIAKGAFDNIRATGSSELRIAATVDIIESEAFKGITGFQDLSFNYCQIKTVNSFSFKDVALSNIDMTGAIITTLNSFAFDNVEVTVKFESSATSFGTIMPCAFGGITGPTEFRVRYSSINATTNYAFGGMQHIVFFTLEGVIINYATENTLKGMFNVHIDPNIQNNGNTVPGNFNYDGTTSANVLSNIRQICLSGAPSTTSTTTTTTARPATVRTTTSGTTTSRAPSTPSTTTSSNASPIPSIVPTGSTIKNSIVPSSQVVVTTTKTTTTKIPTKPIGTDPTISASKIAKTTPVTASQSSTTASTTTGNGTTTTVSGATPSSGASLNSENNYSVGLAEIRCDKDGAAGSHIIIFAFLISVLIIILIVLLIIIILLVVVIIAQKKRKRNYRVTPTPEREEPDYSTGYDARGKATKPIPESNDGQAYYISNARGSQEHLVSNKPRRKKTRSNTHKEELSENGEIWYTETAIHDDK